MTDVLATPFHLRTAACNRSNAWVSRNGFTLARAYSDAADEALAARFSAIMTDISWRWRAFLEGERVAEFVSRLTTRNADALTPGEAHKVLWLSDGGGVRGAGVVARYGRQSFLLAAAAPDTEWIGSAAARFKVGLRDITTAQGGLAVIGPYARAIIAEAGLDAALEAPAFRKLFWRGLDVTVSRWGEHGGFEIWCEADDAVMVWDRIAKAGHDFAILPAGLAATDILDMEAGVARPVRDYRPAIEGGAADPSPKALRLEKLIDPDHAPFNGRYAYLAASPDYRIVGIALDGEPPAPDTPLFHGRAAAGRMLTSLYSPALRRSIGWAHLDLAHSTIGTELSLGVASRVAAAHVADLPFLPVPAPIDT